MHHKTLDWLTLARELGHRADEVAQRTSISRAYYAAYHRCLDWEKQLPARGADAGCTGVHAALIARLRHPDRRCTSTQSSRSKLLGKLLWRQRERRRLADYRLEADVSAALVVEQLRAAAEVLSECDKPFFRAAPQPPGHPIKRDPRRNADTKPPRPRSPWHRAS